MFSSNNSGFLPPSQFSQLADLQPELDNWGEHLPGGPGDLGLVAAEAVHVHPHRGPAGPGPGQPEDEAAAVAEHDPDALLAGLAAVYGVGVGEIVRGRHGVGGSLD